MSLSAMSFIYKDSPLLEKARTAFLKQEFPESLQLFEKAVKAQPRNILALTDAARAFGQRYEIEKSLKYTRRITQLSKGNPEVDLLAAQSLRMSHRPGEALSILKKIKSNSSAPSVTHLELAVLLERRHQLDEALDSVEQFLRYEKSNVDAQLLKARILRRSGEVETATSIYNELSKKESQSPQIAAQALNEWANLLDQQGDYNEAFAKLTHSKSLLEKLPVTKHSIKRAEFEHTVQNNLLDSLTPEHIENWRSRECQQKHQRVLLTGCPRSGTTLIEKILDSHSGVVSADELNAFASYILPKLLMSISSQGENMDQLNADHLDLISDQVLQREERRYGKYLEAAMNESIGDRILLDKNPSLTFQIPAMLKVWPNTKILYALRDPRDIALSCFFRWLPMNSVSVRYLSLEDTLKRTAEELGAWKKIKKLLPTEAYLETRYEDTVANKEAEASNILQWMGLQWQDDMNDYRKHMSSRGVNSPTYEAVEKPIYKNALGRWKNYQSHFSSLSPQFEQILEELNYTD